MSAGYLKYWREAATTMIVHCRKRVKVIVSNEETFSPTKMTPKPQPKEKKVPDLKNWELDLLIMRSNPQTLNGPETYTCPCNTIEDTDFSGDWLKVFGATSRDLVNSMFSFTKKMAKSAPLFHRIREERYCELPPEVAFRVNAIRETFLKSGVLLARSADIQTYKYSAMPSMAYSFGDDHDRMVAYWRKKCREHPDEFMTMCQMQDIVPDIWSLFDWANWLTPADPMSTEQRLDNIFFVCCLQDRPALAEDFKKDTRPTFLSPRVIQEDYMENRVTLSPPLMYETARLTRFHTTNELMEYLKLHCFQPINRCMPVIVNCNDGVIYALPGDSIYPEDPDIEKSAVVQTSDSIQDLAQTSPLQHRLVVKAKPERGACLGFQISCNIELPYGHITPAVRPRKNPEV